MTELDVADVEGESSLPSPYPSLYPERPPIEGELAIQAIPLGLALTTSFLKKRSKRRGRRGLTWIWMIPPLIMLAVGGWVGFSQSTFAHHITQKSTVFTANKHGGGKGANKNTNKGTKPGSPSAAGNPGSSTPAGAGRTFVATPTHPLFGTPTFGGVPIYGGGSGSNGGNASLNGSPIQNGGGSGVVTLELKVGVSSTLPLVVSDVAPGDRILGTIDLHNIGNQAIGALTYATVSQESNPLTQQLLVSVSSCTSGWKLDPKGSGLSCAGEQTQQTPLSPLDPAGQPLHLGSLLNPGNTLHLLVQYRVPSDTGNSVAGRRADLTIRFTVG